MSDLIDRLYERIEELEKAEGFRKANEEELHQSIAEYHEENSENGGFWLPCTGCYETFEGRACGTYSVSKAFKCLQGSGCHECNGLGVVFDDTDYEDFAKFMRNAASKALKGQSND